MPLRLLTALITVVSVGALGEDYGLHLQLGGAYRSFGDVQVESVKLRHYDSMYEPGGPLGIQGYSVLPGLRDGSGVTADQVAFRGGDVATDNAWAPVLGVQKDLWRQGALSLRLTAGLAYYTVDASLGARGAAGAGGQFAAQHYNYLLAEQTVLVPPINDAPLPGFSPGTSATFQLSHFEMDLLVLDLGLRAQYDIQRFYLAAGVGPAFYWAHTQSTAVESGAWNAIPGTGDPGFYREEHSASGSDTAIGLYASLSAGVHLSAHIAAELEVRLDEVGGMVGTAQAALDLRGQSGLLKIVFDF
jgi:hypothetical protein